MSAVMFPMFLPDGTYMDKLMRVIIAITLFEAAYMAEVVRGGLQALPRGQYDAAKSLGMGYWRLHFLVILPQALKLVIPGIANTFLALVKDTPLIFVVGLLELAGMIGLAKTNPKWLGMATEGYVFAALVFWIICFSMSRYSQNLEKKLKLKDNMSNIIELKNVNKWFDKFQVLKEINLEVKPKEIVFVGPSGSGKSTLIRCINRLEEHQKGSIIVDSHEISENTKNIENIRAEVGMVFQQFNLFPHLSILDNCTLAPIWVKKLPKKQAEELAMENLKRVQIEDQVLKNFQANYLVVNSRGLLLQELYVWSQKLCYLMNPHQH